MRVRVCGVIALSLRLRSRRPHRLGSRLREQHLAAGDRVRVHAAADLHVQPQRPVALDALQVDVVEVVEHADVAGLADVLDELLEDRPDRRGLIERAQRRERRTWRGGDLPSSARGRGRAAPCPRARAARAGDARSASAVRARPTDRGDQPPADAREWPPAPPAISQWRVRDRFSGIRGKYVALLGGKEDCAGAADAFAPRAVVAPRC